jgi:hypothetical protein
MDRRVACGVRARAPAWVLGLLAASLLVVLSACGGAAKSYYPGAAEPSQAARGPMAPAPPAGHVSEAEAREEPSADTAAGAGPSGRAMPPPPPSPVTAGPARDMRFAQAQPPAKAPGADKPKGAETPDRATPAEPDAAKTVAADATPIYQMLIYTARLHMAVFEVDKSLAAVEALARDSAGFLARRTDREITIRVPVEKFYEVMKKLEGQGDVLHRDVQVEDVTEQFLEVSLRLKNARKVRDRLAQLLSEAKSVKDALEVERELERVTAEIERLEGRIKFLRDRARFSTITVAFEPIRTDEVKRDRIFRLPFPWLNELGLGRLLSL